MDTDNTMVMTRGKGGDRGWAEAAKDGGWGNGNICNSVYNKNKEKKSHFLDF